MICSRHNNVWYLPLTVRDSLTIRFLGRMYKMIQPRVEESLNALLVTFQSINQISITPIFPEKPDSVARPPNWCSTAKSMKQFCNINGPLGVMLLIIIIIIINHFKAPCICRQSRTPHKHLSLLSLVYSPRNNHIPSQPLCGAHLSAGGVIQRYNVLHCQNR